MPDLDAIPAATLRGDNLSLRELLYSLKLHCCLEGVLREAVLEKLITEEARREGLTVTDNELQQAADDFRARLGLFEAEAARAWLRRNHLTDDDLEARVERGLLRQKLREHVTARKVQEFFAQRQGQYDRARVAFLVVDREGLAQELLSQLQEEGRDFAELARRHSLHPSAKQDGGHVGVVRRKDFPDGLAEAIFQARPGDVVGPLRAEGGFHLVQVQEIHPAQLDGPMKQEIQEELFQAWLRNLVQQAQVQWCLFDELSK